MKNKIDESRFWEISSFVVNYIHDGFASNIEDLLNITYTAEYLDVKFSNPATNHYTIFPEVMRSDLEWFITAVLSASINIKKNDIFKKFISKIVGPNDSIISFNYDLIFENAAHKTVFDINYGFDDGWEPKFEKKELLFLKLHGSVDWMWCEHCGLSIDYNKNVALDINENKSICLGCKRNKGISPVMIPPIFNKEQYFVKMNKTKRNLRDVWLRAFSELSVAKKIIFIGYSLPFADTYAQALFKFGISYALDHYSHINKPEIEIINPDTGLFKKYSNILNYNRIHQKSISFREYVTESYDAST
jgi:NAD-dependent SIR2 family protein deacetylase